MGKKVKLMICPACGSPKLRKISLFSGWLTPEVWVCPDCGYRGPVYAETEAKQERPRNSAGKSSSQ